MIGRVCITHRTTRLLVVTFALTLVLLIAACGEQESLGTGGGSSASPESAVTLVPATSTAVDTFGATVTTDLPVTPATTAESGGDDPSPDTGIVDPSGLTLEEAQVLVPFDIVLPDPLPAGLTFVNAEVPSDDSAEGTNPDVVLSLRVDGDPGYPSIVLGESVEQIELANSLPADTVLAVDAELLFGETPVTQRTALSAGCFEFTFYDWESDGLFFIAASVSTTTSARNEPVVLDLIASIVGANIDPATLPVATTSADGIPEPNALGDYCAITLDQARSVATFPVTAPNAVPAPFVLSFVRLQHGFDDANYSSEDETATAAAMPGSERGDPDQLALTYVADGSAGFTQVILTQSNTRELIENSPLGGSFESDPDIGAETIEISGVEVMRVSFKNEPAQSEAVATAGPEGDNPALDPTVPAEVRQAITDDGSGPSDSWYGWIIGDAYFLLNATIDGTDAELVTDADVEALIAAFIAVS